MMNQYAPQPMTLSRRGRRELAWRLRHERGWTLARIGHRLGVKPAAVSGMLRRAAIAKLSLDTTQTVPHRVTVRRVRAMSLSSIFQA